MVALMPRTYTLLRGRAARAAAALAVCLLIAGCGGGGSTTAASSAVAGTADSDAFNPSLAGNAGPSSAGGASALVQTTSAVTPTPSKPASTPASTPAGKPHTNTVTVARTVTTPAPRPRTVTVTVTVAQPAKPAKPKTVVHVVKRTVTNTVTRTVTTRVAPQVPSGAFMPAGHPALAQASFTVPGSNVGCAISHSSVRCDIEKRAWTPPSQPRKCSASWGNAVVLESKGAPAFVCGGASAFFANAKVVPDGWDDKYGGFTCQVRSFGVNCFSARNHGFIVSRTGYTLY